MFPALNRASQLLLVTADSWDEKTGVLRLYERRDLAWSAVGNGEWPVDIGKNGLGWGRGVWAPENARGPQKREGDGRAPAGAFELGEAFGYAPSPPPDCRLPYRQATERDYFVDDPAAPDYNRWVKIVEGPNAPERRWRSFERMLLPNELYRWGIVVRHNMDPVVPAGGSCIFLHLWRAQGHGTAGCTAMTEERMRFLLGWLDPARYPLLVQLPRFEVPADLLA